MKIITSAEKPIQPICDSDYKKSVREQNGLIIEALCVALSRTRDTEVSPNQPSKPDKLPNCWLRLMAIQQELQLLPGGNELAANFSFNVIWGITTSRDPRPVLKWLVGDNGTSSFAVA